VLFDTIFTTLESNATMQNASQRRPRIARRAALIAVLVCATCSMRESTAWATPTACGGSCCPLRVQDQLWLVSDRGLGCNVADGAGRLQYWRYDCQQLWTRASLNELLAAEDPDLITTVFVHGNRIGRDEAFTRGWSAYRALVRRADERPVRFIIWSWPSDPVRGLLDDARLKANRTNVTGYYLAWFLDRLNPQSSLSLWGHSYGARAVTGALHLLGGGQLAGRVLGERVHPRRDAAQVVLLVAALDNHWLIPGHTHGRAMSQTQELLLVNNSADRLLKRYHLLYGRRSCATALGYFGISRGSLGADGNKVRQVDASCQVGKRHQVAFYLGAPGLMGPVRATLLKSGLTAPLASEEQAGPEAVSAETIAEPDATSGPELIEAKTEQGVVAAVD